jgi:hypothetical protein
MIVSRKTAPWSAVVMRRVSMMLKKDQPGEAAVVGPRRAAESRRREAGADAAVVAAEVAGMRVLALQLGVVVVGAGAGGAALSLQLLNQQPAARASPSKYYHQVYRFLRLYVRLHRTYSSRRVVMMLAFPVFQRMKNRTPKTATGK